MPQRESLPSTYVRTYRTYIFGTTENTVALLTRETRTLVPYTWATSPQTPRMELLRFFSKETNLSRLCFSRTNFSVIHGDTRATDIFHFAHGHLVLRRATHV